MGCLPPVSDVIPAFATSLVTSSPKSPAPKPRRSSPPGMEDRSVQARWSRVVRVRELSSWGSAVRMAMR